MSVCVCEGVHSGSECTCVRECVSVCECESVVVCVCESVAEWGYEWEHDHRSM